MELVLSSTVEWESIDFEAIVANVDLLEVAERYTELRRRGRVWLGSCPLHTEDTPSFTVTPENGRWYCYGCHKGGDVINLVAQADGIKNGEAARQLADQFQVAARITQFTQVFRKTQRQMDGWRERQEMPPPLDQGGIPPSIPLDSYRGFSVAAIKHFGLRRIPGEDWGCGIYIPIKDIEGILIGYSIRQADTFKPKYLNSQGLKKQGIMFGLAENLSSIKEMGYAVLVEGQFDAIEMWQRGVSNVLSVMGSSLSVHQALALARLTNRLVLMFDGDEAGRQGMKQIVDRYGSAFDITTIVLPEGIDPCTSSPEHYISL